MPDSFTTNDGRAALLALAEAATPGPCKVLPYYQSVQSEIQGGAGWKIGALKHADALFYIAARTAVPALLAENEELRAALRAVIVGDPGVTWSDLRMCYICGHGCGSSQANDAGYDFPHKPDCPVTHGRALLGGAQ